MLIVISDLHLGDGTCGKSISSSAFDLFVDRLGELARKASFRADGTYRPIDAVEILMLGDCLDVLNSTRWLDTDSSGPDFVRPWTDPRAPRFAATVDAITDGCLENNCEAIALIQALTRDGIEVPAIDEKGAPDSRVPAHIAKVRVHYMIGNHDWYYHLAGDAFDAMRAKVCEALGLSNPVGPFPHRLCESADLARLLQAYGVYAQHGDIFDSFNYGETRDAAALGDVLAVEVFNRFAVEARRRFDGGLPDEFVTSLGELANVRPAVATPLWIASQCREHEIGEADKETLKTIWDGLCKEFLVQPFVRSADRKWRLQLELGVNVIRGISFKKLEDLVLMARKPFASVQHSMSLFGHALQEEAFRDQTAAFIVYGHSHRYEHVPLDAIPSQPRPTSQMYLNSGTWHHYYDLAVNRPEQQRFIPFQVLTYLAFFNGDERGGRRYETWSGAYAD